MASPNAKKRTLSEQRESDVATTKVGNNAAQKEIENETGELCTFDTFLSYLLERCKASDKEKTYYLLSEEHQALMESWSEPGSPPMNMLLNHLHFILVPKTTEEAVSTLSEQMSLIGMQMNKKHKHYNKNKLFLLEDVSKALQEQLKKNLAEIRDAWAAKNYQKVFDQLFALTYEGIIGGDILLEGGCEDTKSLEEILHGVSDSWTKLLTNADKEFCQDNLTLSDKHFIHTMLDTVKDRAENLGLKWTFHKTKLPPAEVLNWPVEQQKYNVHLIYESEQVEESGESADGTEDDENEDEGAVESNEEKEAENGEAEPPTKRKNLIYGPLTTSRFFCNWVI
ncbi:hypothetical protein RFI_04760 [Reticulomyxa filosa]|uniref:Uncharacterized protein n=1 Tax=Reticulomyxa filosa TaxID=46433 RepID=X6P446_RETFI|nr:hypothetical protein RFI_04760 [Reticulomyxa filosa]|eukprot:ETO32357.1 hypothetical protein RFI_04760 [Reticulomyxa filosa]